MKVKKRNQPNVVFPSDDSSRAADRDDQDKLYDSRPNLTLTGWRYGQVTSLVSVSFYYFFFLFFEGFQFEGFFEGFQ